MATTGLAVNLWWLAARRRGLPLNIDEAGYLQRSFRDADALRSGGLGQLWKTVRLPDPQAPLLTALSGGVQWITKVGPYPLIGVVQIFYLVAVVMTYWAARRLMDRRWSLLAAVLVATMPGILSSSRQYEFSLPAAAMLMSVIAAQMHVDDFESLPLSLIWGLFVGLAALSRTYVLALVPGLVVIAAIRLLVVRPGRRSLVHLVWGLVVAVAVAGSWYITTWHVVLKYLSGYGYGNSASRYGVAHSVLSWTWWTFRLNRVVNTEVMAPAALALVACALGFALTAGSDTWVRRRNHRSLRTAWLLASAWSVPVLFLIISYLVLASTANRGTDFELPLLAPAVVLCMAWASRASGRIRPALVAVCVASAVVSFLGASIPSPLGAHADTVGIGSLRVTIFDPGRSLLVNPPTKIGHLACAATPTCAHPNETDYLRSWLAPTREVATLAREIPADHHRLPVIFFATQDQYLNTNTVDLDYQLQYSQVLSTGLLVTARDAGATPLEQLQLPAYGIPNMVITGPLPTTDAVSSDLLDQSTTVRVVQSDGFSPVAQVGLPDGRTITVWWKNSD